MSDCCQREKWEGNKVTSKGKLNFKINKDLQGHCLQQWPSTNSASDSSQRRGGQSPDTLWHVTALF